MHIITCQQASKTYHTFDKPEGLRASIQSLFHRARVEREALKPFTFAMEQGEFLGLMGPNGAGKSTLMKVLTGIIAPTGGTLDVLGEEPFHAGIDYK